MGTNTTQEKLEQLNQEEDEEEEEALSLCDLPVNPADDDKSRKLPESPITEALEEFDFRTWGGIFSEESEMCAADEVFFQGKLLPLRRLLSTTCFQSHGMQLNRYKSESLDHVSLNGFRSNSRRSSTSLRSDQNSSSRSSSSTTTMSTPRIPEHRAEDQLHTHPSDPKPQLSATLPRQSSFGNQGRKVSAWEFFRLGVVPASEVGMKIQKLMVLSTDSASANKNYASRNSRSSSSSGKRKHFIKYFVGKSGGLWRGCKYSVETVQSEMVMIKGGAKSTNKIERTAEHAMEEKVLELKRQSHGEKLEKKTMSRRRTSEWIMELSDERLSR